MSLPMVAEGVSRASPATPTEVFATSPACPLPPFPDCTPNNASAAPAAPSLRVFKPDAPPPDARDERRRNLSAIIGDGALWSVMVGTGESAFAAFALAVGLGEVLAAQVSTLPVLAGASLQLASPALVRLVGSNRTWVITSCTLQAFSLLLLASAAWAGPASATIVFSAITLYWACGFGANPAWSTWMEELVPQRVRARFFACRTRISQFFLLGTLLAAGGVLHYGKDTGHAPAYFAALFVVAAVARLLSVQFMTRQSDSPVERNAASSLSLRMAARQLVSGRSGSLVAYLLTIQAVVYISGPYFTPYLLVELDYGYGHQMALSAAALVGRIVAMPWLGRFAQRAGPRRLLWLGGVSIVPLAAAWLVSSNFYYLLALQFACGVAWGAYELAMFLMFFETMPKPQRTALLSLYHFGSAFAQFLGGLIGARVLLSLGHDRSVYHALFVTSSVLRIAALFLLMRVRDGQAGPAVAEPIPGDRDEMPGVVA